MRSPLRLFVAECDQSCRQWMTDKRGRRVEIPRRYPLERLCCAVAYIKQCSTRKAQSAGLKVIAAQLGRQYATEVHDAVQGKQGSQGTGSAAAERAGG